MVKLADTRDWLSVIMLDIDFFKQFNDAYGHQSGDRCISMVAAALNRAVKNTSGFSARYGGEEFTCFLPGADSATAMAVAHAIRNHIGQLQIPHERSTVSPFVTISIATARRHPDMTPENWTRIADAALHKAKAAGRNQIRAQQFEAA
ncbi:MAG: diguanylate cyclase [Gemmobacter sp.]|nr:diguanylate cyclase [Gemmobacter sp.]